MWDGLFVGGSMICEGLRWKGAMLREYTMSLEGQHIMGGAACYGKG